MSPDYEVDLSTGEEELSSSFDQELLEMQDRIEKQAEKQAAKHLKTHGREIKRLKKHAERALFANNKEQYVYAIDKLRTLYKQKLLPKHAMITMFETSRAQIVDMAKSLSTAQAIQSDVEYHQQTVPVCSL
ncbi:hypothetical protein JNMOADIG_00079 [Aeromonas phage avDM5]|uniref:Uncharacterized protein n=1 Tax=Aeromonas phage vB_AehM_DM2 TaxID=2973716 RepID=A0AA94YS32_9CAUD|nr:hypothetical protein JNMOADIG_00079 [Aeromonas phage avDM5]UYD60418.1 hypothetical protein NPHMPGLK_00083 [Aeromonas phage avDM2]UYD60746.1 hypothetical protein NHNEHLNL_00150 [Aeromonas phage avDM2]